MINPYDYYGNPDEIAALSPRLTALANRLEARSAQLNRRVEQMGFEGPKAERLRSRIDKAHARAASIAGHIADIANGVILASTHSAQLIYEYEQAIERAEDGPIP
jgi:hypothetical protein